MSEQISIKEIDYKSLQSKLQQFGQENNIDFNDYPNYFELGKILSNSINKLATDNKELQDILLDLHHDYTLWSVAHIWKNTSYSS